MTRSRRSFLGLCTLGVGSLAGSQGGAVVAAAASTRRSQVARWSMPAEDVRHERTWMCWPSTQAVWGADLAAVQDTIAKLALLIAEFEPVTLLARPDQLSRLRSRVKGVQVVGAPVDDLWARDTLPNFLRRRSTDGTLELGASHARFNGWGAKQVSSGDTQLARIVAEQLRIGLAGSGLTGEGGGIEVDGTGTVLASVSSWVNKNRNPGRSKASVETAILSMLGAHRMIWVDGIAGHDITDGHIDTLARFVDPKTILVDKPAYDDPNDPWVQVAERTLQQVQQARTADGRGYKVVQVVQPAKTRLIGKDFLSTYMNYYVCNNGIIAPQFGDNTADAAARRVLADLFPDRDVIQINIDPLAAGGGGIHCATQQQPSLHK